MPGPQPRQRGSLWPGGHEPGTGPGGRGAKLWLGTPAPPSLAWGPAVSVGTSVFPSAKWDHSRHLQAVLGIAPSSRQTHREWPPNAEDSQGLPCALAHPRRHSHLRSDLIPTSHSRKQSQKPVLLTAEPDLAQTPKRVESQGAPWGTGAEPRGPH